MGAEKMDFEKKLRELEKISERLNNDDLPIDEGINLFEQSVSITKECMDYLKEAKGKITQIKKELDRIINED